MNGETRSMRNFVGRVVIVAAIALLVVIAVQLRDVLVLVFGSVLVAVALRAGADAVASRTGCSERIGLTIVVIATIALLAGSIALLGDPVAQQLDAVRRALPAALESIRRWLESSAAGKVLLEWLREASTTVEWGRIAGIASGAVGALGATFLMLFVALYLAADPALYRRGLLKLLPTAMRPRVDAALRDAAHALSRWLLAQGISMLSVGVLTGAGLALVGAPLALPLGLIAGVLEFIPFVGTFGSSALIVLLAFSEGVTQAFYALAVCLVVQQLESYVIQPVVSRWAISLPPAVALLSVIVFGALFGALGVVFAVPLAVVAMRLVDRLYVQAALEGVGIPIAESIAKPTARSEEEISR